MTKTTDNKLPKWLRKAMDDDWWLDANFGKRTHDYTDALMLMNGFKVWFVQPSPELIEAIEKLEAIL